MHSKILLSIFCIFFFSLCSAQTGTKRDSICKFGQKFNTPKRITISFPVKNVTDEYKLQQLHKAIPDSYNNEDDTLNPEHWWLYHYYFNTEPLVDYDSINDSLVTLPQERIFYILRDTYFFDANGDGLLDFIHYPKYYKKMQTDNEVYELFIQGRYGYKWTSFTGYIVNIEFNSDGTLNNLYTFEEPCCDGPTAYFYNYVFDKSSNTFKQTGKEKVLSCQLISATTK